MQTDDLLRDRRDCLTHLGFRRSPVGTAHPRHPRLLTACVATDCIQLVGRHIQLVPTDQLDAIRRYTGGEKPRVSRMGGADWAATKAKVRKAVAAIAEQVVSLHRDCLLYTSDA